MKKLKNKKMKKLNWIYKSKLNSNRNLKNKK